MVLNPGHALDPIEETDPGVEVIKNFLKVYPPLAGNYPCLPAGRPEASHRGIT